MFKGIKVTLISKTQVLLKRKVKEKRRPPAALASLIRFKPIKTKVTPLLKLPPKKPCVPMMFPYDDMFKNRFVQDGFDIKDGPSCTLEEVENINRQWRHHKFNSPPPLMSFKSRWQMEVVEATKDELRIPWLLKDRFARFFEKKNENRNVLPVVNTPEEYTPRDLAILGQLRTALQANDLLNASKSYRRLSVIPDGTVFEDIIESCVANGLIADAVEVLKDMRTYALPVSQKLLSNMVQVCFRVKHWPRMYQYLLEMIETSSDARNDQILKKTCADILLYCNDVKAWSVASKVYQLMSSKQLCEPADGLLPDELPDLTFLESSTLNPSEDQVQSVGNGIQKSLHSLSMDCNTLSVPNVNAQFICLRNRRVTGRV